MNTQTICYALAKQVPDMAQRGFVIGTCYGDLTIEAGPLAQRIAAFVQAQLQAELHQPSAAAPSAAASAAQIKWFDDFATGQQVRP